MSTDPPSRTAPNDRLAFDPTAFRWAGIEGETYKPAPGLERGMAWKGVTRHRLASPSVLPARFEGRDFELEPGGSSSLEKHGHVHFVVALRGAGRALDEEAWERLSSRSDMAPYVF